MIFPVLYLLKAAIFCILRLISLYLPLPPSPANAADSAGSFRDLPRVAYLNETMWTELFLDDADFLEKELDILIGHLTEYRDAIRAGDGERLRALLKDGREKKAAAGGN